MNSLTEKLSVIYLNKRRVELIEPWQINDNLIIPKGFSSDLGSVPKFFWWFLKPTDLKYSAIIHDYEWLLADSQKNSYFSSNSNFIRYSQELDKIPIYKAYLIYYVLQIVAIYKSFKKFFINSL
jgi:Protein of unknown function (DUF1353)